MAPQRLLKLTLAHYRNPDCSEEECHRFLTEEYIPKAVEILQRHKLEIYSYVRLPLPPSKHSQPWSFQSVQPR